MYIWPPDTAQEPVHPSCILRDISDHESVASSYTAPRGARSNGHAQPPSRTACRQPPPHRTSSRSCRRGRPRAPTALPPGRTSKDPSPGTSAFEIPPYLEAGQRLCGSSPTIGNPSPTACSRRYSRD